MDIINKESFEDAIRIGNLPMNGIASILMKIMKIDQINKLYDKYQDEKGLVFVDAVLNYLNIKIVITPIAASNTWDYTKEWIDIGTTIFGAVPFALYSANTANINEKLNATDTTKMLEPYAKGKAIQVLSMTVDTKLATKDTAAMLAPYAKMSYNLDSNYLKKQINK